MTQSTDYACGRCGTRHEKKAYGPGYGKVCPDCGSGDVRLTSEARHRIGTRVFASQAARDIQAGIVRGGDYGDESYCEYLDESSQQSHDYYMGRGDEERANLMLTRSLSEALRGNDGE